MVVKEQSKIGFILITILYKELGKRDYSLAVVTTEDAEKAVSHLRQMKFLPYFSVVLRCDRMAKCKPEPGLVFEVCRELGVAHTEAAVIGDTYVVILMRRNANAACYIKVASGVISIEG